MFPAWKACNAQYEIALQTKKPGVAAQAKQKFEIKDVSKTHQIENTRLASSRATPKFPVIMTNQTKKKVLTFRITNQNMCTSTTDEKMIQKFRRRIFES